MHLREYMALHGLRQVDVAKAIGSYQATISELLSGKTVPLAATIQKIHVWTDGKVSAADLIPVPEAPRRPRRRPRRFIAGPRLTPRAKKRRSGR